MPRKNNFDNPGKKRISVYVPSAVIEDIKKSAADRNVSASYFYTQLMCEGYSHFKTQKAVEELQEDVNTLYLGLELIGAKIDEVVRLIGTRTSTPQNLTQEEKEALKIKAATLARVSSNSARKAVQEFRTGESNVDPLGVEKLLEFFKDHLNNGSSDSAESVEHAPVE